MFGWPDSDSALDTEGANKNCLAYSSTMYSNILSSRVTSRKVKGLSRCTQTSSAYLSIAATLMASECVGGTPSVSGRVLQEVKGQYS